MEAHSRYLAGGKAASSRQFRLRLLSNQLKRRSMLSPETSKDFSSSFYPYNPLKNASLSGVSPTFQESRQYIPTSASSHDHVSEQSERLAIYERALRNILKRNVAALKTRNLEKLEQLESSVLSREIEQSFSKYFDISEAQPFVRKTGTEIDLDSFAGALSEEIKISKPKNRRQFSDFISTEPSEGIVSKPGSSYHQKIRSPHQRSKVEEDEREFESASRQTYDASSHANEEEQISVQFIKDRSIPGRLVFNRDSLRLSDLLGDALPSPSAAGTFLGKEDFEVPQKEVIVTPRVSKMRVKSKTGGLNLAAYLSPRSQKLQQIEEKNQTLNSKLRLFSKQEQHEDPIIRERAKTIAAKKVKGLGIARKNVQKAKPMVQMSQKFIDGLSTIGTRFNRKKSEESKLPIRSIHNETLDRIKRTEYNRLEKMTSSFVIRTPHQSLIKNSIDMMQLENNRKLRVLKDDKKKSSKRVRERWQKSIKKIQMLLRMKKFGMSMDEDQLTGFYEASMEKNKIVKELANRYSSQLDTLVRSTPGAEEEIVSKIAPLKMLRQKKKFLTTVYDEEGVDEAKKAQMDQNPRQKRALSSREIKIKKSSRLYGRWFIEPESRRVAKKEKDILEEYLKENGQEALQELREVKKNKNTNQAETSESEDSDDFGLSDEGEFQDPLPLRNDPFKHTINAMQNFVKPLDKQIEETIRLAKQSSKKLLRRLTKRPQNSFF